MLNENEAARTARRTNSSVAGNGGDDDSCDDPWSSLASVRMQPSLNPFMVKPTYWFSS